MIKGVLFAFLAAFSWGAAIVMSKKGLENMDAGGLFFWQVGSAAMLSWFVLAISRKKLPVTKKSILAYSTGIFEPFLAYTFTLYGLKFISAGITAVIFSLESVFILILSVILFFVKINSPLHFILLLTGAMAGSIMVALPDINDRIDNITGYILIVAGVLSASFYVVISSRLIVNFEPVTLLTGQLTFSFILACFFIVLTGTSLQLPVESVFLVFLSGILQYFLAFCFYLYSLRWIPVHIAGAMLYFTPLVALLLSWFFLQEDISFIQGLGVFITILCVYILNKKYAIE
ncbi:DMT family transporter [Escherichia coli]|uniref:DMT family transporter n=1 Tax=Escherichia coli TaxID=562 RepID=UPI001FF1BE6F|nr:DMT family transporter [Escherichia coli]